MPTYGKVAVNFLRHDVSGTATDLAVADIAKKDGETFTGTMNAYDLIVANNLTVNGTQTVLNTETLQVEDHLIDLGKVSSPSNASASGGGIKLLGGSDGDKTITWLSSNNAWNFSEHIHLGDNKKLLVGESKDLEIFFDGTNSYIREPFTQAGQLILQGWNGTDIRQGSTGEHMIRAIGGGAVEAYHNNVKKLETTSTGINVTGQINVNGSPLAGGVSSDSNQNTEAGTEALNALNSGVANNDAFGYRALYSNTNGSLNAAFGRRALYSCTTGVQNVGIGGDALYSITTTGNNTAVGFRSLHGSTGSSNVAVGYLAGYEASTGIENVFIGNEAGRRAHGSGGNTFIGNASGAGVWNSSGGGNTGIGTMTLANWTSGYNNCAVGVQALNSLTSGRDNVAMGYQSNLGTTGNYNVTIGRISGYNLTTGSNNCFLGYQSGGSNSPSGSINSGDNNIVLGNNSINNLYCADTSISSSDSRDKADVTNFTHGLSWVNKLNPITYRWDKRTWYNEYNDDGSIKTEVTPDGSKKRARQHIGFLAQDVLAIEQADGFASKKDDMLVVNLNEDDSAYGLKYERLVPVLVNAIKELSTEINTLKTKVAALEAA